MKTSTVKIWRDEIEVLESPLTLNELKESKNNEGMVSAVLAYSPSDLIDNDIEWLNDDSSERITGSIIGLTDISFNTVAGKKSTDTIYIKVTGNVDDFIDEEENA